jgi:hypothetical protein
MYINFGRFYHASHSETDIFDFDIFNVVYIASLLISISQLWLQIFGESQGI